MQLPVFELVVNDDKTLNTAMTGVALVNNPAYKYKDNEGNFMAFEAVTEPKQFNFSSTDIQRGIVSGLLIEANKPIYRKDEKFGEYNVIVTEDQSYKLVKKFFELELNKNFNIGHDPNQKCEGVTLFECFVCDKKRGIMPMQGFEDVADGSVFISCMIENEDIKAKIASGEIKGFSMEGVFGMLKVEQPLSDTELDFFNQVINQLNQYANS